MHEARLQIQMYGSQMDAAMKQAMEVSESLTLTHYLRVPEMNGPTHRDTWRSCKIS